MIDNPSSATAKKPLSQFAEVALPLPLRQTFTYRLPANMQEDIKIGARLTVPFGTRQLTGYVVELHHEFNPESGINESAIKNATELLDIEPLLTEEIIELTKWTADYYAASWGDVLKASLPAGMNANLEQFVSITDAGRGEVARNQSSTKPTVRLQILRLLVDDGESAFKRLSNKIGLAKTKRDVRELETAGFVTLTTKPRPNQAKPKLRKSVRLVEAVEPQAIAKPLTSSQQKVVELLKNAKSEVGLAELIEMAQVSASVVQTLAKHDRIQIFDSEVWRDPLKHANIPEVEDITLTEEQVDVFEKIVNSLNVGSFKALLLHGVTGSGKTEIYIRAMREELNKGRTAMMLVPEISLTPIFSRRLRSVFGNDVAILHSSLSAGERFDEWRRLRSGEARIAIGTRSAVFAPLENIGLLIVDEEHDTSYRQNESPFYNGRDVAVMRAKLAGATVVLGSATPAMESFYNAQSGKYEYLRLPNRIGSRPLAIAEIIDMREVFKTAGKDAVFSPQLLKAVEETKERGEQTIILLNRRGYSSFVLCRSCGESIHCKNCDITLTYHKREDAIICHYCGYHARVPHKCPKCESKYIYFVGQGTEQLEDILQRKFSNLSIARVDRDTTKRRRGIENVLLAFSEGKIDVLVGTQMLAKGHDFHNVTLVGVVSVDAGLAMPDFRAAERTFQLLTQVAGRAGRGDLPGKVLIQSYYPEHYALRHASTQNYENFYRQEISFRKNLNYPPFVSLALIVIQHENYNYAFDNAQILKESLTTANSKRRAVILGPAPAPLARLKGRHRLRIMIKATNRKILRDLIDMSIADAHTKMCDMRTVSVEIDPVNLM